MGTQFRRRVGKQKNSMATSYQQLGEEFNFDSLYVHTIQTQGWETKEFSGYIIPTIGGGL